MPKVTEAKLRAWRRRAISIDEKARRLMADMTAALGFEDENTDCIDNVLHSTEELVDVLSRPELDMWKIAEPGAPHSNGMRAPTQGDDQ